MYYVFILDRAVDLRHMTRMDPESEVPISVMCLMTQFSTRARFETDYNLQISTNPLSFLWFVYKYLILSS